VYEVDAGALASGIRRRRDRSFDERGATSSRCPIRGLERCAAEHVHIEKKYAIKLLEQEIVSNRKRSSASSKARSSSSIDHRWPHLHAHGAPQRSCLERHDPAPDRCGSVAQRT